MSENFGETNSLTFSFKGVENVKCVQRASKFLFKTPYKLTIMTMTLSFVLKLVRTYLNSRALGASTAAIFLSMHLIPRLNVMLDYIFMAQSICKERMENEKIQNFKFLSTVGLELTYI